MQKYRLANALGDGTYGSVVKAVHGDTNETVAVKVFKKKFASWDECLQLREIRSLRKLVHPNIVRLKEVVREPTGELYMVFECMQGNLYQMIKDRAVGFPEVQVKQYMAQMLKGVAYMHKEGYFHRDLKLENILYSSTGVLKIADFGLAREIRSRPPFTDYVSTRWYRAPEVILRSTNYNSPVDLWAMGAIMAELFSLRPLFPGSSETDQIFRICSVMGTPTDWSEGQRQAACIGTRFPQCPGVALGSVVHEASSSAIKIMEGLLAWDPLKRLSAEAALRINWFDGIAEESGLSDKEGVVSSVKLSVTQGEDQPFTDLDLILSQSSKPSQMTPTYQTAAIPPPPPPMTQPQSSYKLPEPIKARPQLDDELLGLPQLSSPTHVSSSPIESLDSALGLLDSPVEQIYKRPGGLYSIRSINRN